AISIYSPHTSQKANSVMIKQHKGARISIDRCIITFFCSLFRWFNSAWWNFLTCESIVVCILSLV
ncbi:TPA: hypothetical protein ACG4Y0_002795, partial [Enterococcus faecium]